MNKILLFAGTAVLALVALTTLAWGAGKALGGKQTETHTVAEAVRSVVVDVDTGDIELVRGADRVVVRDTRRWSMKKPVVERRVRGGVLTVTGRCHGGWPISNCSTDLRVSLPAGVPVHVMTHVGDVSGLGLQTRDANVRTDVGDVHLALALSPDRLVAESDVGDVRVEVPRGRYAVETSTDVGERSVHGLVQDERAAQAIRAATDVGDVDVEGR